MLHLNHVAIHVHNDGTTTRTVTPSSGTVVAGAPFVPVAGRLLVCVIAGAPWVDTPAGWSMPSGGHASAWANLMLWHRIAAGGDTVTTTMGADHPSVWHWIEFPAGSVFGASVAGTEDTNGGPGPLLTGVDAPSWVAAAMGLSLWGPTRVTTWSAGEPLVDVSHIPDTGFQGYTYSLTHATGVTGSWSSAATVTNPQGSPQERIVFAVQVSSGAVAGTLAASTSPMSGALSGVSANTVELDATTPRLLGSVPGVATNHGTVMATAHAVRVSIVGQARNTGALQAGVSRLSVLAAGASRNAATLHAETRAAWAAITGAVSSPAGLYAATPRLTAALTGQARQHGTATARLRAPQWAQPGALANPAALTATIPLVTVFVDDVRRVVPDWRTIHITPEDRIVQVTP